MGYIIRQDNFGRTLNYSEKDAIENLKYKIEENMSDLDNFKEKKGAVLDKTSLSIMADKSAHGSFNDTNILQTDTKVNSDTSTRKNWY